MTTRFYLKDSLNNEVKETVVEGSTRYYFQDMRVWKDGVRFYDDYGGDPRDCKPLPPELLLLIEEVTYLYHSTEKVGNRESGDYKQGSTTARVTAMGEKKFVANIKGKTVQDVATMLSALCGGTIRPEVSFEGPQHGIPTYELWQQNKELQQVVDKQNEQLLTANRVLQHGQKMLLEAGQRIHELELLTAP
jgi:hypothetical protein